MENPRRFFLELSMTRLQPHQFHQKDYFQNIAISWILFNLFYVFLWQHLLYYFLFLCYFKFFYCILITYVMFVLKTSFYILDKFLINILYILFKIKFIIILSVIILILSDQSSRLFLISHTTFFIWQKLQELRVKHSVWFAQTLW